MDDQDMRDAFGRIDKALTHQSTTQGKIFDKVDATNTKLDQHIHESIDRKGKMELKIHKIDTKATDATEKIDEHLGNHKKKTWWILGIIGSVIATVVAAMLLTLR